MRQFRSPQLVHGLGPVLAALIFALVGAACSAADSQHPAKGSASIGSDVVLKPVRAHRHRVMRREDSTTQPTGPPSAAALQSGSILDLSAESQSSSNATWNPFGPTTTALPTEKPSNLPLFKVDAGGAWDGDKQKKSGEYGFAFEPEIDMNATALGRHIDSKWNHKGLYNGTFVTLWGPNKQKLREVFIGPLNDAELGGKYMFKYIDPPIALKAKQEYRLTQTCTKDMKDTWSNQVAQETDIELYTMQECIKVKQGVKGPVAGMWPAETEEQFRRAGMLNIRFNPIEGCGWPEYLR